MGFSLGGAINSLTGATNSAQRAQDYAQHMALLNNQFQKEFAKNAHQWEVEDLKKAGINPILTATGGGGADTGGAGGGITPGAGTGGQFSPLDIVSGIVSAKKALSESNAIDTQAKVYEKDILLKEQEILLNKIRLGIEVEKSKQQLQENQARIDNLNANTKYTNERARGQSAWMTTGTETKFFGSGAGHTVTKGYTK